MSNPKFRDSVCGGGYCIQADLELLDSYLLFSVFFMTSILLVFSALMSSPNGKREFVPSDQVSPLIVVYSTSTQK